MRRFIFAFISSVFSLSLLAAQQPAKELATLIRAMVEETSIHPDSLYSHIARLEARKNTLADPTERAVNQAVLGYLYYQRSMNVPYNRLSKAVSDSVSMPLWGRKEYLNMAHKRYAEALADKEVLYRARISDWVPLVKKGKDDDSLADDMLMLVWREADQVNQADGMRTADRKTLLQELLAFYKQKGNRQAALWMAQELACNQSTMAERTASLLKLKDEYQDLSLNARTYQKLSLYEKGGARQRVAWLQEGLRRYPHYKERGLLQQELNLQQSPMLMCSMESSNPYPGRECRWFLEMRNVATVRYMVYRIPDTFDEKAMKTSQSEVKFLQKHAVKVSEQVHRCTEHPAWEVFTDTLHWTTPALGRYALVFIPSVPKGVKAEVNPKVTFFSVTCFSLQHIALPNGVERLMVNDAMSGSPVEGAECRLFRVTEKAPRDTIFFLTARTDREGKADIQWPKRLDDTYENSIQVSVTKGEDRHHPNVFVYYGGKYFTSGEGRSSDLYVYTDRSIYRPGQTVHVGGVDSYRENWAEAVQKNHRHKVSLMNPNRKLVEEKEVVTDSMGVFSLDFQLPASGITGRFCIVVDGSQTTSISVEEYKRPSFEVKMDEAPAIQMPVDSITLTGRALTYSGVPVRNARVTGRYHWEQSWWRWMSAERAMYSGELDSVFTDMEGRFHMRVPIEWNTESLQGGKVLVVNCDVVSATGEIHTAQQHVFISSTPLNMQATVPNLLDRDNLKPWSVMLMSSTSAEVKSDVKVMLKQNGKVVAEGMVSTGKEVIPEVIRTVPSGRYDLHLLAVMDGDSASFHKSLVLFSQHDIRLVVDTALWCYVPDTEVNKDKPARFRLGTSEEAWVYYTLVSDKKVVADRLLHLNDTVLTVEIPYDVSFGKAVTLSVTTVKGGRIYSSNQMLSVALPDKKLKYRWITFRDRLQPGQQETWLLQLQTPEGKPAKANLMTSLYDASLDAIRSHSWYIFHHLYHNAFPSYFESLNLRRLYLNCRFTLKPVKVKSLEFGCFNPAIFNMNEYGKISHREFAAGKQLKQVMFAKQTSGVDMASYEALDHQALQGRIAGLDIVADSGNLSSAATMRLRGTTAISESEVEDAAEEEGEIVEPVVSLRENFNETAFFYPTLRTNENGEVMLSFTLPESLTTWRLLGLAHTQDMLTALLDERVVAQKDLMAQLSLPRFLRQGDEASLSASIYNINKVQQKGRGVLTVQDAETEKVLLKKQIDFNMRAEGDTTFTFSFHVPQDASMLICRWVAEGSTCSDGEQRYLPVLTHQEWVTDTRVLTYGKEGIYRENMKELFAQGATRRQLTVEYVSQPVWYAVQALPSLVWPQREDVLSLASAYYAGSLAGYIVQQNPVILSAIRSWQARSVMQNGKLLQNADVKNIVMDETPWIALAEAEKDRVQRLSTLFDPATQNSLQKEHLDKLRRLQQSDGSFCWFPGMKGSYYLTREVAYLLTRQKVLTGQTADKMLQDAVGYIRQDRPTSLSTSSLRYLYVLYQSGVQMDKADRRNADSLIKVLMKHPEELGLEERALAAIVLKKAGQDRSAARYLESVKKFLVTNKEGLTYFEFSQGSRRSINRKLHIHVQVMEALAQLSPADSVLLNGMQRYLLHHKRTSEWDSPVNTANAIYSLLLRNEGALLQGCDAEVTLQQGRNKIRLDADSSSFGYIRKHIEVDNPVLSLEIKKRGSQESWGGIYAQYLAPVSEVSASMEGDLNVKVILVNPSINDSAVQQVLKAGSRIHVRYEITAKRDFEYVFMHAPRPATAEPVLPLSGYQWNAGLEYYRAIRDAAADFYFDYLPRGSYVIEEDWFVEHEGLYSTGITTIQCLYAPEFSGRSADNRVKVSK